MAVEQEDVSNEPLGGFYCYHQHRYYRTMKFIHRWCCVCRIVCRTNCDYFRVVHCVLYPV